MYFSNCRNIECLVSVMAQIGVFLKGWFVKLNKDPVLAMTICHLP